MGGLAAIKEKNEKEGESACMISLIESKMFKGTVVKKDRSLMNVPFVTGDEDLDAKFVKEAKEAGLENSERTQIQSAECAQVFTMQCRMKE